MVVFLLAGILTIMVLRALVAVTMFALRALVVVAGLICAAGVMVTRGLVRTAS